MCGSLKYVAALVFLSAAVFGIPSSLIEDIRVAKSPVPRTDVFLPNKVKRAKEAFMYGDRQRQIPQSGLSKYYRETRYPRNYKTGMADMHYFPNAVDQRMKRAPVQRRSIHNIRSKRNSEIDPKDLLLLLALWEGKLGIRGKNRGTWQNNYLADMSDGDENDDDGNQVSDFDESHSGEWMDGPIVPNVRQSDDIPSENHWDYNNNNHKRFVVPKQYYSARDEGGVPYLYTNQFLESNNIPLYRRMIR